MRSAPVKAFAFSISVVAVDPTYCNSVHGILHGFIIYVDILCPVAYLQFLKLFLTHSCLDFTLKVSSKSISF